MHVCTESQWKMFILLDGLLKNCESLCSRESLSLLQMVILAQPWLGFNLVLFWFSTVLAIIPIAITCFLPKVLSVFVGFSIKTLDYPDLNYIAGFLFPTVFSLSPLSGFHSSFCVTLFNLILQIVPDKLSVLAQFIQSLVTHGLAMSLHSLSLICTQG